MTTHDAEKRFYDARLRKTGRPPSSAEMGKFKERMRGLARRAPPAEGKVDMDNPFFQPVEQWEKRDRDGSQGKWRYHGVGRFKERTKKGKE